MYFETRVRSATEFTVGGVASVIPDESFWRTPQSKSKPLRISSLFNDPSLPDSQLPNP